MKWSSVGSPGHSTRCPGCTVALLNAVHSMPQYGPAKPMITSTMANTRSAMSARAFGVASLTAMPSTSFPHEIDRGRDRREREHQERHGARVPVVELDEARLVHVSHDDFR